MLRDEAVLRINRGLGFLPVGHAQTNDIISCLQEAQRDLEKGKTIPRFLLRENETLTILENQTQVALPVRFLRPDDDNPLSYVGTDSNLRQYLTPYRYYREAVEALQSQQRPDQPALGTDAPSVYVILNDVVDFIVKVDRKYTFTWNYYEGDAVLTSNIENKWLKFAPEWLIGEAGIRMALDKRDEGGVQLFTAMMQKARMAVFGDDVARDESFAPIAMGANL